MTTSPYGITDFDRRVFEALREEPVKPGTFIRVNDRQFRDVMAIWGVPIEHDASVEHDQFVIDWREPPPEQKPGVWVTYYHDYGAKIDRCFAEEIEAHRHANGSGYLNVGFVPYDQDISEALR